MDSPKSYVENICKPEQTVTSEGCNEALPHGAISSVSTSGSQGQYVHFGGKTYLRSDLMFAFGGDLNPGLTVAPRLKLGNATPMGLFAFATTTLILSFINSGARGVKDFNVMLGAALFYGGIIQVITGIWELLLENPFGATVFSAYGGFWMSFAVLTMKGFNISSSYTSSKELDNALGLYLLAWAIVTFMFTMCTLRSTIPMFSLLFFLTITYILLASGKFTSANGNADVSKHLDTAGGIMGCITAAVAYYNAMAGLLTNENSWIRVKPLYMPGAVRPDSLEKQKEA